MKSVLGIGLIVIVSFVNGYSELSSGCDYNMETEIVCDDDEYTETESTTPGISAEISTATSTTGEPLNDVCVGQNNGVMVDNPASCEAFYFCIDDLAFPGTCPPSALFNPILGTCDLYENVNCPGDESTTEAANLCYGEEDFTFLNDERTCDGYFLCFNSTSMSRTCRNGTNFDPSELVCTEQFECEDDENIATTESNSVPDSCPSTGSIAIPDPFRCSRFSLCAHGLVFPMACEPDHHFNSGQQKCLPRDIANCNIAPLLCDAETPVPVLLVNPQYCEKFFICFNKIMHPFECAPGQHFDLETEQCLDRRIVGCETTE